MSCCVADSSGNAGGALDVILISDRDGTIRSTDWHVVFDRLSRESAVAITINGHTLDGAPHMRVSRALEPACFVDGPAAGVSPGSATGVSVDLGPPPRLLDAVRRLHLAGHLIAGNQQQC